MEQMKRKYRTAYVLNEVFRTCLKLLHPFMPFVTSEIYNDLVNYDGKDLMVSEWPKAKSQDGKFEHDFEEEIIEKVKEIIVEIRNVRSTKNIHPSKKAELILVTDRYQDELKQAEGILLKLGFADSVKIQDNSSNVSENSIHIVTDGIEVFIPLEGLIDLEEEKKRVEQERKRLQSEIERCEKMLSNPGFMNKAPQAKIDEEKEKLAKYKEMLERI